MIREVRLEIDKSVAKMYISNPKRKNAISQSMFEDITRHCVQLREAGNIRVLTISGEGGDFASGADTSEKLIGGVSTGPNLKAEAAFNSIEKLPFPVIAVLEGYALGGGMTLAAACDLRIAADNTKFSIPGAKRGIGLHRSNVERLVRWMGAARTMEVLFYGEMFSAEKALAWGFVNEVVPAQDLDRRLEDILNILIQNAPLSLKATKINVRNLWNPYSQEKADPAEECYGSEDFKEGIQAFAEKRKPNFIGR